MSYCYVILGDRNVLARHKLPPSKRTSDVSFRLILFYKIYNQILFNLTCFAFFIKGYYEYMYIITFYKFRSFLVIWQSLNLKLPVLKISIKSTLNFSALINVNFNVSNSCFMMILVRLDYI